MVSRNVFSGLHHWTVMLAAILACLCGGASAEDNGVKPMANTRPLTPAERRILIDKGTEPPGSGEYLHNKKSGVYHCRRCDAPLYRSKDKFDSGCGWPAFDDEIPGAVLRQADADGRRTEILCANCGGHLGHVFLGERLTPKNTRHCVNSLSMRFEPEAEDAPRGENTAYFAAGCFWGVEHLFRKEPGVVAVSAGYMGGRLDNPGYREVCGGKTGHAEAVRVIYDPRKIDYELLCRLFFEIHDFTQVDGQGPDLGPQYRSEIFTVNREQADAANRILDELVGMGYEPATRVTPAGRFWPAEEYHQDYYGKTGKTPYCHVRRKIFLKTL